MCCTRLAGNAGRKSDAKNRHLRTIAQLCRAESSQLRHVPTIWKYFLNSNVSATCLHNMESFGPLAAEISSGVLGTSANFDGFRVLLVSGATSFTGGQPNFARCLAVSWAPTLYINFPRLLPPDGISPRAKFALRPSLVFSYIGSVTARLSSNGVSQTLRRGTRNGITELSQRAPPIFGWRPSRWASAHIVVIMPHHITTYVDAVSIVTDWVTLSVGRSVCLSRSWALQNRWVVDSGWSKETSVRWGSRY